MRKAGALLILALAAADFALAEPAFYLDDGLVSMALEHAEGSKEILSREDIEDKFNLVFVRPDGSPESGPYVCDKTHTSMEIVGDELVCRYSDGRVFYHGNRRAPPEFRRENEYFYQLDNGRGAVAVLNSSEYIRYLKLRVDSDPPLYLCSYGDASGGSIEAYGFRKAFHVVMGKGELSIFRGSNLVAKGMTTAPPNAAMPNTKPCPPMTIAPLATNATALTTAGWEDMSRGLYRRHLLTEGYLKYGQRSPAWDNDAIDLIEGFIGTYVNPWDGIKDDKKRLARSQSILDRGCQDPYVQLVHGFNLHAVRRVDEAAKIFDELIPVFSAPGRETNSFMQFFTEYRRARAGDHKLFLGAAETALLHAASDGSIQNEELRRLLHYFTANDHVVSRFHYHRKDDALIELVGQNPGLDPWFRETLLGYLHLNRAWCRIWVQDFDPARMITWDTFSTDLDAARKHLEQAIAIQPGYPEPYCYLIKLARLAPYCNQEEERQWFDRAISRQFDFMPAYEELIDAFRPANGGSIQQLFDLGLAFAQTRRYDTQVPDYIYRTIEEIGADTGNLHDILDQPEAADALFDTAAAYVDRNVFRTRNLTRGAVAAWFYGDYAAAGKFLAQIPPNTPLNRRTVESFHTTENELLADVRLHTGRTTGRLNEEAATTATLKDRQFLAQVEKQLATGEWTPLMKAGSLDGWSVRYGDMTLNSNQVAETRNNNRRFQLRGQMDLGDAYELAVDFELDVPTNYVTWGAGVGTYNSPPPFGGAGLCNAEVETAYYPGITNVYIPSHLNFTGIELGLPRSGAKVIRGPDHVFPRFGRNTLLLRANGSRAEVYLNKALVRTFQYRVNPGQNVYPYVYAPDTGTRYDTAVVRYGNVRARRLAAGTRPDSLPPPVDIKSPVWVEAARRAAERMDSETRGVGVPSGEGSKEDAAQALVVENLPEGEEPFWISILPPDESNSQWRVAWENADGSVTAAGTSKRTYTLMQTADLTQPFTPLRTGITNMEVPISMVSSAGFFKVVTEPEQK